MPKFDFTHMLASLFDPSVNMSGTPRRAKLLDVVLFISLLALFLLTLENAFEFPLNPSLPNVIYLAQDLGALVVLVLLAELNRRGKTAIASWLFLLLAVLGTTAMFPAQALDHVLVAYAVPVFAASFLIRPRAAIIVMAFVALNYTVAKGGLDVSHRYNYLGLSALGILAGSAGVIAMLLERSLAFTRESEQNYRQLFDGVKDAVIVYSPQDGLMDCNLATLEYLGYTREEFLRLQPTDIVHPDFHALMQANQAHLQTRHQTLVESIHRHKDGHAIPVEVNSHAVEYRGRRAILSVVRDITERKQAEKELRENQARLQGLMDSAPDAMIVTNEQGAIILANTQAENLFGYAASELLGMKVDLLVPDRSRAQHQRYRDDFFSDPANKTAGVSRKIFARRRDGSEFPAEITLSHHRFSDQVVVLSDIRDASVRQQIQDTLQKNQQMLQQAQIIAKLQSWTVDLRAGTIEIGPQDDPTLGWALGTYTVQDLMERVHPDDRQLAETAWATLTQGASLDLEYRMLMNDEITWVHVKAIVTADQAGKPVAALGVTQDITERKRTEDLVRAQRDLARIPSTVASHPAVWQACLDVALRVSQLDAGGFYLVNPNDQALELVHHQGLNPEFVNAVARYPADAPNVQILLSGVSVYRDADELYPPALYQSAGIRAIGVIPILQQGHVIGCLNVASHTQTRIPDYARHALETIAAEIGNNVIIVRTASSLQASEARYRGLVENMNEVVIEFDSQGRLVYLSPSYSRLLGYPAGTKLDQSVFELIHPADREQIQTVITRAIQTGEANTVFRIQHRDGAWHWVESSAHMYRTTAGEQHGISVSRDITKRKQAEAEATRRTDQIIALNDATLKTQQSLNADEIYRIAAEELQRFGMLASVYTLNPNGILEHRATAFNAPLRDVYAAQFGDLTIHPTSTLAELPTEIQHLFADGTILPAALAHTTLQHLSARHTALQNWMTANVPPAPMLLAPLTRGNTAIGFFGVMGETLTHADLPIVMLFARQVSVALENARLFAAEQARRNELGTQYLLANALVGTDALDETLRLVTEQAVLSTHVTFARIALYEHEQFVIRSAHPVRILATDLFTPCHLSTQQHDFCKRLLMQTDPVTLFAGDKSLARQDREAFFLGIAKSACLVPLRASDVPIGVLILGEERGTDREPFNAEKRRLARAIGDQAASAIHRAQLNTQTHHAAIELANAYDATIEGWSRALDLRDNETEGHTQRVTELTLRLAREFAIPTEQLIHVRRGALLHDIGKMGVPDAILLKPGMLDEHEWEIMRRHPDYAQMLLSPIHYLAPALDIPYCHHERWDGTGYPRGLAGEAIPLVARLFAVVDVWDAMTSNRPYRAGLPQARVCEYIREHSGTHFDPRAVQAFLKMMNGLLPACGS